MMNWSNWSGSVLASAPVLRPKTEGELADLVRRSVSVRATGAGHSFMPLCQDDVAIVQLDDLEGELRIAPDRASARVPAGWSLRKLTAALWQEGLALANQGDVNPQSLAGALATGTHGTGPGFGNLSTLARSFRSVGADGQVTFCDRMENADLFEAQRLSLGLFGIATEIEIDVVPAFYLRERLQIMSEDAVCADYDAIADGIRNAEFWYFPHASKVIFKTLETTEPCPAPKPESAEDEEGFKQLVVASAANPAGIPALQRLFMDAAYGGERSGPSFQIFPSERNVRFEEMEYEIPRAQGMAALKELIGWIRRKELPVAFPIEYRLVAEDDIWISPMNKGPVAAISFHQYAQMPWRALFSDAEAILRDFGGRPHWAKRHTLKREDVDQLYPMAERYREVRRAADPQGKFLNSHLAELFS